MPAIPATEAKQSFGKILDEVMRGESYTVFRRSKPVARIVPIGSAATESQFGALAAYADANKIEQEEGAFLRAMEEKHEAR